MDSNDFAFSRDALEQSAALVHGYFPPTPQYAWPLLRERLGCDVIVKHENHTPTGAFKARGGLVYLDRLKRERPQVRGLVSATRGNHGQSLGFAGGAFGVPVSIVAPVGNSTEKNAAMRAFGAELVEHGKDFEESVERAKALAEERGYEMVPSFHPDLVQGVSTYALELFSAFDDIDTVYVPIGQGSGICGLIRARDLLGRKTDVVGVVSTRAPAYKLSFEQGQPVTTNSADTFADGMACRSVVPEALALIRAGAARVIEVSDDLVADAIRLYYACTHNLAEGAGAAPLAGLMSERERMAGKRVAVILCGGNIDTDWMATVLGGDTPVSRTA